jgi:transketolase
VGINRFGASAPGEKTLEMLGFTPDNVARAVKSVI